MRITYHKNSGAASVFGELRLVSIFFAALEKALTEGYDSPFPGEEALAALIRGESTE